MKISVNVGLRACTLAATFPSAGSCSQIELGVNGEYIFLTSVPHLNLTRASQNESQGPRELDRERLYPAVRCHLSVGTQQALSCVAHNASHSFTIIILSFALEMLLAGSGFLNRQQSKVSDSASL